MKPPNDLPPWLRDLLVQTNDLKEFKRAVLRELRPL